MGLGGVGWFWKGFGWGVWGGVWGCFEWYLWFFGRLTNPRLGLVSLRLADAPGVYYGLCSGMPKGCLKSFQLYSEDLPRACAATGVCEISAHRNPMNL